MTVIKGIEWGTTSTEHEIAVDKEGNLLFNQVLPEYTEITRRGDGWSAMNTTAIAALVVRPDTVANFTLFNNNPSGSGVCFVIDRAFAFNLVSTTALVSPAGLWLCVHPPMAAPTNDITARASSSGKVTSNSSNAICDTGATVADNGWFPWGLTSQSAVGVLPGSILTADIEGRIIVPPQCGVSTQVVSADTGETFTSGFSWYVVRDMEIE